ncbi:LRR receptor-like serine/threonine-protein kinase IOS1 [Cardamine amara subsp. amara]|uniref:non-specific serine/threonine protein kinase n=1 Tax=Cardamine amara subsp. amara TaxID=228776 RepID=A0ABD1BUN0_CARAN
MMEVTGLRRLISKFFCGYADSTIEYEPYVYIPANSYTYADVTKITKKFNRVHGKGEFGVVYHGVLNNQQVAVKMLNRSSIYNIEQFTTEVHDFVKVGHKNLVRLIGYCDDGEHLALIYEFVANGNLNDHLSGKFGNVLSWESRLIIIIGVAHGLEYLHNELRILHRYIKPTNILLDENFEPKLADFGLSRSSPTNPDIQASNKIYVKPGRDPYLDDIYFNSNWLTKKSDIYSFGIVLLEMITNQPVVDINRESPHMSKWVDLKIAKGDTLEIVDPRLNNDFDSNSVRKAIEIASTCAARAPHRPSMSQVVIGLSECLALELARTNGRTGEITRETQ